MHKKLVNKENQFVVIEIEGDEINIADPILEKHMTEVGVFIPPPFRDEFGGKSHVKLDDPDFIRAFETFFVPSSYRQSVYTWVEESEGDN